MTIQKLISINSDLNNILDSVTKDNRLESIQIMNELLMDRETVFRQLDMEMTKKNPLVTQLLSDEKIIKNKMQCLMDEIKKDLQLVSQKKSKGGTYINPYKNLYVNGAFIDKKK